MTQFLRPASLTDAVAHLARGPMRILAGGTDLYPATQAQSLSGPILDITAIPELRGITESGDGLRIGACTTWTEIAQSHLPAALNALQAAAREVGGRQIQNTATIGGNLCNASPAADSVPPLLILDAQVELAGPNGQRRLPLADFLKGPRKTALAADETLVAIRIPRSGLLGNAHFIKLGARAHLVISIAMVAVRLQISGGNITNAAVAVGACSATARRLPRIEAALRGPASKARIDTQAVARALSPLDDLRATAAYRNEAAAELLRRAIAAVIRGMA